MLQPSRHRPAAYGAACSNCSRAKSRCVRPDSGGKCDRCQRLDMECHAVVGGRRKGRSLTAPKKVQLEEKIDGLVSLLTSSNQRTANATESLVILGDSISARNAEVSSQLTLENTNSSSGISPVSIPHPSTTPNAEINAALSIEEQEECLYSFQTQKLKHFPFVYIPLRTSARDLQAEQPFLWLCIMAVSTKSTSHKTFLCNLIRREIAQKMLYSLEKSLDLLLGILTCTFWGNFQVERRPFLSLYTQLAASLVFDLGLNKPAPKEADAMSGYRFHLSQLRSTCSMQDRRAVLAFFMVNSVVSLQLRRIDTFRWTAHMDDCLEKLTETPECEGDSLLALLVRSQLILEKASQSQLHPSPSVESDVLVTVPAEFYHKSLLVQLCEVRQKIPPELQTNDILHLHLYHTELRIHEAALPPWCALKLSESCNFSHLETLHAYLVAIASWFEVFFKVPPAEYIGFTFATFSQLTSSAIALYKLSTLEDPAWDKAIVRRTSDILKIADRVARNLEEVAILAGLECDGDEEDTFTRVAGKIKAIMQIWADKLSADFAEGPRDSVYGEAFNDFGDLNFHLSEDAWLPDGLEQWAW